MAHILEEKRAISKKNMAPNRKNFGAIFHGFWRMISPSFGLKIGQGALTSA